MSSERPPTDPAVALARAATASTISVAATAATGDPTIGLTANITTSAALALGIDAISPQLEYVRSTFNVALSRFRGTQQEAFDIVRDDAHMHDMVTLILQEIPRNTADTEHLANLGAVLGHALNEPDDRATARQVLTGLSSLSSRHVTYLADVASLPEMPDCPGTRSGDDIETAFAEDLVAWEFAVATLRAVGFVTNGRVRLPDGNGYVQLDPRHIAITAPGRWALDVLAQRQSESSNEVS